ncbi:MAG: response regulator transcription factor [Candidatus Anammoxibacter sp.]
MSLKILVVEDENHIRSLLIQTIETAFEEMLDDDELEIFEAADGAEGFRIASDERPALIFSDIMMPKMNGFELGRKIKKESDIQTHFILLTAKFQEIDKEKGLEVGANEYITKPFNPENIISTVESILGIKRCDKAVN